MWRVCCSLCPCRRSRSGTSSEPGSSRDGEYPREYLGIQVETPGCDSGGTGRYLRANRLVCALSQGLPDCGGGGAGSPECIHLCDNKRCINPLHLAWASKRVNRSGNSDEEYLSQVWLPRGGTGFYAGEAISQLASRWLQQVPQRLDRMQAPALSDGVMSALLGDDASDGSADIGCDDDADAPLSTQPATQLR